MGVCCDFNKQFFRLLQTYSYTADSFGCTEKAMPYKNVLFAGGTALATSLLAYFVYHYIWRNVPPKKWRRVGVLATLRLFPLKSGGQLELNTDTEVICEVLAGRVAGILDRSLMLLDSNNKLVTGRVYPQLVLIKCKMLSDRKLQFYMPEKPELQDLIVDFDKLNYNSSKRIYTKIHTVSLHVEPCGEIYDKWFSQAVLGEEEGLKLVHYPFKKAVKGIQSDLYDNIALKSDAGTFTDATSYHLINLASVTELNTRTSVEIQPIQFRANFEVSMDNPLPFAEDHWDWLKIGENAIFRNIAPCGRCIMPNINYSKGDRLPNNQPLSVLKEYRKRKNGQSADFGIHLGIRHEGKIKTGDVVYISDD